MTGLVVKLRPFEKLLINGAVLQNGSRATRLRIRSPNASVLRLRDALHPLHAETTAGRIYYVAQLAVAGEADPKDASSELGCLIESAIDAASELSEREALVRAREAAAAGKIFAVMRAVKPLLNAEKSASPEAG